ncbi:AtpZ/AtpI family protein [Sneathiella sp.]|uniref:AtpZ/AtpI family protein n=1 Tax=Sneathiella sp. TaxID=1964365 RepID=UPI003566B840
MDNFIKQIKTQARRKVKAQNRGNHIWSGFGMFGLIGWSIALPVVLGALLGIWIDKRYPGSHSWTLILLVAGLCIGCWNAARWVMKEHKNISDDEAEDE